MTLTRLLPFLYCCFIFLSINQHARGACIDSVHVAIKPVQCAGFRNGKIGIDSVFGGAQPYYYSIDGQSYSTRPVFEYLEAGSYMLYVRDAAGCIWSSNVYVAEPEALSVHITGPLAPVEAGVLIDLKADVTPETMTIKYVSWSPPELFEKQNSLKQITRIFSTTDIGVEVQDQSDCIARDYIAVKVDKTHVYIPNVIKINAGNDDYFTIFAGEGVSQVLSLQVFNRNGGVIFERANFPPNDPQKGWNGRWCGKPVLPGVYPYLAVVEYYDGSKKQFQGDVTVLN